MKRFVSLSLFVLILLSVGTLCFAANNYCSNCGQKLSPGSNFCPNCGAAISSTDGSTSSGDSSTKNSSSTDLYIGDVVIFGSYEQDNNRNNGKEAIEWIVLDTNTTNRTALLISRYCLDCMEYNYKHKEITWENCSLRSWLNSTFYSTAFSSAEQNQIAISFVPADVNSKTGKSIGNDTYDSVFILNKSEVEAYFYDEYARCAPTPYALAQGADASEKYLVNGNAACWWWLRSPGLYSYDHAARVNSSGAIDEGGYSVSYSVGAIRPSIWVSY